MFLAPARARGRRWRVPLAGGAFFFGAVSLVPVGLRLSPLTLFLPSSVFLRRFASLWVIRLLFLRVVRPRSVPLRFPRFLRALPLRSWPSGFCGVITTRPRVSGPLSVPVLTPRAVRGVRSLVLSLASRRPSAPALCFVWCSPPRGALPSPSWISPFALCRDVCFRWSLCGRPGRSRRAPAPVLGVRVSLVGGAAFGLCPVAGCCRCRRCAALGSLPCSRGFPRLRFRRSRRGRCRGRCASLPGLSARDVGASLFCGPCCLLVAMNTFSPFCRFLVSPFPAGS